VNWDVIVVGGRCAGAPLAMLLARAGLRVLVLDKARFPSDTVSTHTVQLAGVCRLREWGLLPEVLATGCPLIERISLDLGFVRLVGTPHPRAGLTTTLCCRRVVLDQLLLAAAARSGAQVRTMSPVKDLVAEGGRVAGIVTAGPDGRKVVERAAIVVGADGHRSTVARLVGAAALDQHPSKTFTCYAYWRGLSFSRVELFFRPGRAMAALPTNDNAHIVVVQLPISALHDFRSDVRGNFLRHVDVVPRLGEEIRRGEQAEHFRGAPDQFGVRRHPFGPGWVLIGDAACHKDSVTAQGISDAFHDAHTLAGTLISAFTGECTFQEGLQTWEKEHTERILPVYRRAVALADLAAPDADEAAWLRAMAQDQAAVDDFLSIDAGTKKSGWGPAEERTIDIPDHGGLP
jgi:2-polyprenyl-6-methoxyphenol hydroxylase-like FAD-dependent oxidoreductase